MDRRSLKQQLRHERKRDHLLDTRGPKMTKSRRAALNKRMQWYIHEWYERQLMIEHKNQKDKFTPVLVDLLEEWKRRQTIANCKIIKEEIIAAAWNPDRMMQWIEQGFDPDEY